MIDIPEKLRNLPTGDFRDAVFGAIEEKIRTDKTAVILTNDMGAMGLDRIARFAPERVINVGITEQNMMGVASGMALSGRTVFVYGIISHIIFRALEQIELDICVQNLPVILVGVGSGLAYGVDGPTHHGTEDVGVLRAMPQMTVFNPSDCVTASHAVDAAYRLRSPCFIRMDKENLPNLYSEADPLDGGIMYHGEESDGIIVGSGMTVWPALRAQEILASVGVHACVVDLFRIKPLGNDALREKFKDCKWIVVVDEGADPGGIADAIARAFIGQPLAFFHAVNLGEQFLLGSAKREWAWEKFGFEGERLAKDVLERLEGTL